MKTRQPTVAEMRDRRERRRVEHTIRVCERIRQRGTVSEDGMLMSVRLPGVHERVWRGLAVPCENNRKKDGTMRSPVGFEPVEHTGQRGEKVKVRKEARKARRFRNRRASGYAHNGAFGKPRFTPNPYRVAPGSQAQHRARRDRERAGREREVPEAPWAA